MAHVFDGIDPIAITPPSAGNGEWTDAEVADDNDERDAASAMLAAEAAINRTNWLRHHSVNGIDGGSWPGDIELTGNTSIDNLTSTGTILAPDFRYNSVRTFFRTIESTPQPSQTSPWIIQDSTFLWLTTTTATHQLKIPLNLPQFATLKEVTIYIIGAGGHAAFPGGKPNMPVVNVKKFNISTGGTTTLVTATDLSATAGAYEAAHGITATLPGAGESINRITHNYYVQLLTEDGANGLAGTFYIGGLVTYTTIYAAE
jgi:hypothetical protein